MMAEEPQTRTKARPSLFAHNHALWCTCHAFVDVVDEHVEQARHRLLAAPSHVWRDNQMWQMGIDQRIALGWRLIGNHIKACAAQAAVFQGGDECGFIDQAAAANVDDDATWFQVFQFCLTE